MEYLILVAVVGGFAYLVYSRTRKSKKPSTTVGSGGGGGGLKEPGTTHLK